IDSKYIIDDFFFGTITKTDIRIDYYDRFLKESDNRLDAITFILTSDDDFDNKIYFYFTDKAFIERELTAVDHWNNFYDNAEILGEDIMKIFSLVLILVVLALTLPLLQPIISILFAFAKFVINVVWWVVTLPFKLIATLFKK
ncbi:MAG: hypothetical protein IKA90_06190, partial [Clostridia bacterium]|nr:hypothetical protein [Clostridia bacterium]